MISLNYCNTDPIEWLPPLNGRDHLFQGPDGLICIVFTSIRRSLWQCAPVLVQRIQCVWRLLVARKISSQYHYYLSLRLLFWSIYLSIFQGDLLIDFPRFLMNGLTWCGRKGGSGMDYKSCPYECSKQKPFWGQAAAKVSGKTNERVLTLIRLAQDQTLRWLYPEM